MASDRGKELVAVRWCLLVPPGAGGFRWAVSTVHENRGCHERPQSGQSSEMSRSGRLISEGPKLEAAGRQGRGHNSNGRRPESHTRAIPGREENRERNVDAVWKNET